MFPEARRFTKGRNHETINKVMYQKSRKGMRVEGLVKMKQVKSRALDTLELNAGCVKMLDAYLAEKNPEYAVMITGSWGSGKSYFVEQYLNNKPKRFTRKRKRKAKTVSLFGIDGEEAFERELLRPTKAGAIATALTVLLVLSLFILAGIFVSYFWRLLDKDMDKKLSLIVSILSSFLVFLLASFTLRANLKSLFGGAIQWFSLRKIVIIDDFERITTSHQKQALGFLYRRVLQDKRKLIIICSEENLEDVEYAEFREKVIGPSMTVKNPNISSYLSYLIKTRYQSYYSKIDENLIIANSLDGKVSFAELVTNTGEEPRNLRALDSALLNLGKIFLYVSEKQNELLRVTIDEFLNTFWYLNLQNTENHIANEEELESRLRSRDDAIFAPIAAVMGHNSGDTTSSKETSGNTPYSYKRFEKEIGLAIIHGLRESELDDISLCLIESRNTIVEFIQAYFAIDESESNMVFLNEKLPCVFEYLDRKESYTLGELLLLTTFLKCLRNENVVPDGYSYVFESVLKIIQGKKLEAGSYGSYDFGYGGYSYFLDDLTEVREKLLDATIPLHRVNFCEAMERVIASQSTTSENIQNLTMLERSLPYQEKILRTNYSFNDDELLSFLLKTDQDNSSQFLQLMIKKLPDNDEWKEEFRQRIEGERSSTQDSGNLRMVWKIRNFINVLETLD